MGFQKLTEPTNQSPSLGVVNHDWGWPFKWLHSRGNCIMLGVRLAPWYQERTRSSYLHGIEETKQTTEKVSQEGSSALSTSRLFQSSYSSVIDSRTFWQYPVLLYQPCPSKGNSSWFRLLSTKNTSLLNWFCWTRLETIKKKPFQLMRLLLYELVAWLPKEMA